jgi:hypothetical protein
MKFSSFTRIVFLVSIFSFPSAHESLAQAPDWMFALEGTYIGRVEDSSTEIESVYDVRLDGLRNGDENGFVLQFRYSTANGIREKVEMWNWNVETSQVLMTTLEDNKPFSSSWFVEKEGAQVVLSRGGEYAKRAVIHQLRVLRLPGQLRMDYLINAGSGAWELIERYVLDEENMEE